MTILFTLHALERIKHRKIGREEIIACIINPDKIKRSEEITRAIKKINDQESPNEDPKKIVREEELEEYLADKREFLTVLPSGRTLLRRSQ
ncbi:MAG: DUF4258 domain-containing protein [Candidatus Bathyarchaeia archaeon]